ncbi:MAG: hypothetical protein EA427_08285 [Spirochaetaceae bacterium]|nr:MAG: hypothetical protein EA427_08285 [Spirochaetaceae bacterium]
MRRFLLLLALICGVVVLTGAQEVIFRTSGTLAYDASLPSGEGDSRNSYSIRVREGVLLEAIAASTEVDTWVDVQLPDGTTFSNDDYVGLDAGFLRLMPASGELRVTVSALYAHQEGSYTLTVREMPPPRTVVAGDRVSGTLTKGAYEGERRADLFHLRGEAGEQVVIELLSEDFDAFLEVVDQSGRTFFDDDGGRGFNSRLAYRFAESGSLTIIATSALGDSIGSYELRVTPLSRNVVARYEGRLRPGGRRSYDGKLVEVYEYNGRMGQSVAILLESDDFDPVLYLNHADGRHLAMDDDSGGNANSLLDVVLPSTETYRIYVVPFTDSEGAYRLTIFE